MSSLCSVVGAAVVGLLAIVAAVVVYRKVSSGSGGPAYKRCAVGVQSMKQVGCVLAWSLRTEAHSAAKQYVILS
jgi:hypothetical protein